MEFANVYPGVNVAYYGNQGQLEYDFVIAPGATTDAIHLRLAGADRVTVDDQGYLVVATGGVTVREQRPITYQEVGGVQQMVDTRFVVRGQDVGFQVGARDAGRPLVIDPLLYFVYLGGPGLDGANDVKVDALGDAYVTGYNEVLPGIVNAFVVKIIFGVGKLDDPVLGQEQVCRLEGRVPGERVSHQP